MPACKRDFRSRKVVDRAGGLGPAEARVDTLVGEYSAGKEKH